MKFAYTTTHMGVDGLVAVTRTGNGTVKYLSHALASATVLMYTPVAGEALCKVLEEVGDAPHMFAEDRWIVRACDQLPMGKPVSMFPPNRHHTGYPGSKSELEIEKPLYAPLRPVSHPGLYALA